MPTIKDDFRATARPHDREPLQDAQSRGDQSRGDSAPHESRFSEQLAQRIGARKFDLWFSRTQLSVHNGSVQVRTDSPFVARWIGANFAADLRDVARQTLGESARVDVKVDAATVSDDDPDGEAATAQNNGRNRPAARSAAADANDKPRHDRAGRNAPPADPNSAHRRAPSRAHPLRRLEHFVVGPSNRLAWSEACRFAADADPLGFSPLFIHGECGLGKTHLLQGICQRWTDVHGTSRGVRYVTAEDFTNEFIFAVKNGKLEQFRQRTRRLDLLAIDDVHFLADKIRTQSEFLWTLDAIGLSGSRIAMASDHHPRHIKQFNQSLVSRCLSGMVVKIERPDRELRLELIKRLAAVRGLTINAVAAETIAGQCVGSVREIEGAIAKLAAVSELIDGQNAQADSNHSQPATPSSREIGVVLTNQVFNDRAWQPAAPIRLSNVIETVCGRLNVVRSDLTGNGRHKRVVLARAMVAYLARELTTHSFPEIAQSLGRTFHSTIHTADQRLRKQLAEGQSTDALGAGQSISLKELSDQLKYQISHGTP